MLSKINYNSKIAFFNKINISQKQRKIVLVVALASLLLLAIPALVVYIIFKATVLRNSIPKIQEKVTHINNAITDKKLFEIKKEPSSLFTPVQIVSPVKESENEVIQSLSEMIKKNKSEISILDEENRKGIERIFDEINQQEILNKNDINENIEKLALELKDKLKLAIQIAGLKYELRKKGNIVSSLNFELSILRALGYTIDETSGYHNKELLYQIVSETAETEIQKYEINSLSDVSKFFQKISLRARLAQINLTDELKIEKIEHILFFCEQYRKKVLQNDNVSLEIPDEVPSDKFPQRIERLKNRFANLKKQIINIQLKKHLQKENIKNDFENESKNADDFEKTLTNSLSIEFLNNDILYFWRLASKCTICDPKLIKDFSTSVEKQFDFMKEFGDYLTYEFIQGFDNRDSVLKKGLCWAIVLQFLKNAIKNDTSVSCEVRPKIDNITRFIQVNIRDEIGKKILGFANERIVFSLLRDQDLISNIREGFNYQDISMSKGWLMANLYSINGSRLNDNSSNVNQKWLNIAQEIGDGKFDFEGCKGHSIAICFDNANKKYELFDPNIGYFNFSNFENGAELIFQCFDKLIRCFYPELFYFSVQQYF